MEKKFVSFEEISIEMKFSLMSQDMRLNGPGNVK